MKTFSKEEAEIKIYNERMEDILKLAKKESLARGIFFGMVITFYLLLLEMFSFS